jgi:hypothetical protein
MPQGPSIGAVQEAFAGYVYRPVARRYEIRKNGVGWSGRDDQLSSLSLQYLLGANRESVIVEVSQDPWHMDSALIHLVFEFSLVRRPRFPMVIERSKATVHVEGLSHRFMAHTAGMAAVAIGAVDARHLMIRCSTRRLARLALVRLDPAELKAVLRSR